MDKGFQLIDGPNVPLSIKPMTELHDKLVIGYNKGRDLKLPKLIQSIEKRMCKQIEVMCDLEGQLQDTNHRLGKTMRVMQEVLMHEDVPRHITDKFIIKMDEIHG